VAGLIFGESLAISLIGGGLGILLTYPAAGIIATELAKFFPIFNVPREVVTLGLASALLIGVVAALVPAWRAVRQPITEGLRSIA
jgi:putative ABC transport system permease protein